MDIFSFSSQTFNDGKRILKKTGDKFKSLGREMFEVMNDMARQDEEG